MLRVPLRVPFGVHLWVRVRMPNTGLDNVLGFYRGLYRVLYEFQKDSTGVLRRIQKLRGSGL